MKLKFSTIYYFYIWNNWKLNIHNELNVISLRRMNFIQIHFFPIIFNKNLNFCRCRCRISYTSSHYNDNKWMDILKCKIIFEYCCIDNRVRRYQRFRLFSNPPPNPVPTASWNCLENLRITLTNFPQINNPIAYRILTIKVSSKTLQETPSLQRSIVNDTQQSWKIIRGTLCRFNSRFEYTWKIAQVLNPIHFSNRNTLRVPTFKRKKFPNPSKISKNKMIKKKKKNPKPEETLI